MSYRTLTVALFVVFISLVRIPETAAIQRRCLFPPDGGNCLAYIPMFAYDAKVGECVPFIYGGCGGNANRFPSMNECMKQCGWKFPTPY
ncbi:Kunitz-type serine protease inhibitor NACI [Paragonimus heterotremus]|uniref:Kunitz-type serine protease inhibitor NACI n=1 Tax=Paragonimus heterotremus TaxID=100268 RepID=A0A8J4SKB5_9TREM|nr:Kunitz-type serine protease inhibitor NACI [Paragonimus heterotremus]